MDNNKLINVTYPTADSHCAIKKYKDISTIRLVMS
jgi:hypothetical protein